MPTIAEPTGPEGSIPNFGARRMSEIPRAPVANRSDPIGTIPGFRSVQDVRNSSGLPLRTEATRPERFLDFGASKMSEIPRARPAIRAQASRSEHSEYHF